MATQPLTGVDPLARDPDANPALAQDLSTLRDVIRLVSVQLGGPLAPLPTGTLNRWNGIDQVLEDAAVMPVRSRQTDGEWDTTAVRNKMALRARFRAVR